VDVVVFNLDEVKGGRVTFSSLADAEIWTSEQIAAWEKLLMQLNASELPNARAIIQTYSYVRDEINTRRKSKSNITDTIVFDNPGLIISTSQLTAILYGIAEKTGLLGFSAALSSLHIGNDPPIWGELSAIAGLTMLFTSFSQIERLESADSRNRTRASFAELDKDASRLRDDLKQIAEVAQSLVEDSRNNLESATAIAEAKRVQLQVSISELEKAAELKYVKLHEKMQEAQDKASYVEGNINDLISDTDSRLRELRDQQAGHLDSWFVSQQEKYRLQPAATLWRGRARIHAKKAALQQKVAIGIGTIGFVVTVVVAWLAFSFAHWLLSDAAVTNPLAHFSGAARDQLQREAYIRAAQSVSVVLPLRATFHAELILTATITLLWLTMYVWAMRVAVKVYTTEHHLAINASGRAAMISTYLGLVKEGAANEEDRPIVLGAIFQPINDGFTSDDGPPPMSMAALAATVAAGKS
jgi:hypothetical protein